MHPDGCFWWQLYFGNFPEWLLLRDSCKDWYQENCPLENCHPEDYPPENCPPPKKKKNCPSPMNISPYESLPLWKLPSRIFPPRKSPCGKSTPNEISSLLINHTNERKNKIKNFLPWRKLCNATSSSKQPRSSLIHRWSHRKYWN